MNVRKQHLIIGSGGHARVLLEALRAGSCEVIGFVDVDPAKQGQRVDGISILGSDDRVFEYDVSDILLVNGIGGLGGDRARRRVFDSFTAREFRFASVIHPSTVIAAHVQLGAGVQIMAGSVLQPGTSLGDNCIVNTGVVVDHECWIGADAHLAPGSMLCGNVTVGEGSHIGAGAVVIQGVEIGRGCIVAAGAVVTRRVPDGAKVMGVPAK